MIKYKSIKPDFKSL